MDVDRIIQDLNERFSAPLKDFYHRRIIIWHDEDREFEEMVPEIALDNAKIAILTGSNFFTVKKLVCFDDTSSNFLVYCPIAFDSLEDNWLLDIEFYGETYRADLIALWMDEMDVKQTTALRSIFKKYRKFFQSRERRARIMAQTSKPTDPVQLILAIMAALAGVKEAKPNKIIKAVLMGGFTAEENSVYQAFLNYGMDGVFWQMVAQGTGYHEADTNLLRLFTHIMLTAATRTMQKDVFAGLDDYVSDPHRAYCYDFISDWLHSFDNRALKKMAELLENAVCLRARFMKLTLADLIETEIFPCINEVILVKLMQEIGNRIIDVDVIHRTVEKRRTCAWYEDVAYFYDAIDQVANMQAFYKIYSPGFHTVEPEKVWKEYTNTYYAMDMYYRLFHLYYDSIQKTFYHEELSELFISVRDTVEGLYKNWFLSELGSNWSNAAADNLREYGRILEVPRQLDFYRDKVESADGKVYVIISDALRYEVAVTLMEQLRRETQCQVEINSMQGLFPTITKFGMAALLPHKKLSVDVRTGREERLSVLADGQSTEAGNRDQILKSANRKSVALKYKDISGMKRADRQALVRGMDVVYIYHDTIDDAGHLDHSIFEACDVAIDEIKNIVRIIVNEFGGAKILITSDHGFLYTFSPLTEDDKVDMSEESDQYIEIGRRYAIMKKGAQPQYLLPVKFLGGEAELSAFTPRESVRIKKRGGGTNFVHGGISLQEMVVPVIDYHFLRNDNREYMRNRGRYDTKPVTIALLSASRKVSNMIFALSFYQKEAVQENYVPATYQLYFTDSDGRTISDVPRIIADKTNSNVQERTFRCTFNLKSLKYSSTETYYLVIADENGLQVSREEFQFNIAFAADEWSFFS